MAAATSMASTLRRLEGKVALITGGASGIGETTARLFAKHGAKVAIADIQDDRAHSVVTSIGSADSTFIHCDATKEDHVRNAVDTTVSKYGKLDIMFNNAGMIDTLKSSIVDNETADFERVQALNVTGVFLGMKHAARVMVPRRSGNIISTGSVSAVVAGMGSHAYTASKFAVVGLTKNLAVELGQFGIRVNCMSPYGLASTMATVSMGVDDEGFENAMAAGATLKGVILKAEDAANAALFLASDEARYVSGLNLVVDGAFTTTNPSFLRQ